MNLEEAQRLVENWTADHEPQYWEPHEILARLTEEVGELAREINHAYGPKQKKNEEESHVEGELGDILFTITCLANRENISLANALKDTLEKYDGRDADRWPTPNT